MDLHLFKPVIRFSIFKDTLKAFDEKFAKYAKKCKI